MCNFCLSQDVHIPFLFSQPTIFFKSPLFLLVHPPICPSYLCFVIALRSFGSFCPRSISIRCQLPEWMNDKTQSTERGSDLGRKRFFSTVAGKIRMCTNSGGWRNFHLIAFIYSVDLEARLSAESEAVQEPGGLGKVEEVWNSHCRWWKCADY